MIHIYTGDGKGKTTAALGLGLRASGRGRQVILLQFLKGRDTGELTALHSLPNISVLRNSRDYGFMFSMKEEAFAAMKDEHNENLRRAAELLRPGDLLLLDEAIAAYSAEALDRDALLSLLDAWREKAELVLTGRDAPKELCERADYITEMRNIKHPFDRGVPAREGIEF